MISRSALLFFSLMVASAFAGEAEDTAGGAAKNEARLLVGKHVRYWGYGLGPMMHQYGRGPTISDIP